jgi:hypothetical protein
VAGAIKKYEFWRVKVEGKKDQMAVTVISLKTTFTRLKRKQRK